MPLPDDVVVHGDGILTVLVCVCVLPCIVYLPMAEDMQSFRV